MYIKEPQLWPHYLSRPLLWLKSFPPEAQDAIATRLLSEVNDEQAWGLRFTTTTDVQWDYLVDKVRRSIITGKMTPLDNVFPSQQSS